MNTEESTFGIFEKEYAFEYGKVSAKKSKLFDEDDYERLYRMGPNEIANFLRQNGYEEEIDVLSSNYQGIRLVERAAELKFSKEVDQMKKASQIEVSKIITLFMRRFDVENLKRFIRWRDSGAKGMIEGELSPQGNFDLTEIQGIENLSVEQIIDKLGVGVGSVDYTEFLNSMEDKEAALDKAYKAELKINTKKVGSVGFTKYLKEERTHKEVMSLLRSKKYGIEENQEFESKIAKEISRMSFEDALNKAESEFGLNINDLRELERELEKIRFKKGLKLINRDPLGSTPIYGYLMASYSQSKNLKLLANNQETNMSENEIFDNLVIP